MNSAEKLIRSKAKSLTRKIDDKPMPKIPTASELSEQNLFPKPESEKLSFAVDWQMEEIFVQFDRRNNSLDFSMRKLNLKRSDRDSAATKSNLYIPDW